MKEITLGKTQITTVQNAFGALPIQRISQEEAVKLLRRAYDGGIRFFDTARAYSDSEHKIGEALSDVRKEIFIASKTMATTAEGLWKDLNTTLSELKTDYLDLYQLHFVSRCYRPGDGTGLYEALLKAKEEGKVRHIGITAHKLYVAQEIIESGLYETLQYPFSYLSSREELALADACEEAGMGFIAMKALAGGLITRSDAAMAFIGTYPNVLPIWGIQRESELDEWLAFMENPAEMTSEIEDFIEKEKRELSGEFCRGCGYCAPCPKGIQIQQCARISLMLKRAPSDYWLSAPMQEEMKKTEDCIHCGQCKKKCPYGLDIPPLLESNYAFYRDVLDGKVSVS